MPSNDKNVHFGWHWSQLKPGDSLLNDVAQHFNNIDHVHNLASPLLDGVFKGGGYGFVNSRFSPGAVPPTVRIAHAVLEEWCTHRPEEATGAKLYAVLHKVLPSAALEFKERLLRIVDDDVTEPVSMSKFVPAGDICVLHCCLIKAIF